MKALLPIVGNWYQETDEKLIFEVVAVDEDAGTIELQHIDGDIDEFDYEIWAQLSLEPIDEPKDWRSGYALSSEDGADNEAVLRPNSWDNPLSGIEPEQTNGLLDD